MKHQDLVGNIGHFDNEIDMAGCGGSADHRQAPGRRVAVPGGTDIIVLSEGRLLNLGNARPEPFRSFAMPSAKSLSTNQVIAQIGVSRSSRRSHASASTRSPSISTRRSARLHLDALGVRLTELTPDQAMSQLGCRSTGCKADHYRYDPTARASEPGTDVADLALADDMVARGSAGQPATAPCWLDRRALRGTASAMGSIATCLHARLARALKAGGAVVALCSATCSPPTMTAWRSSTTGSRCGCAGRGSRHLRRACGRAARRQPADHDRHGADGSSWFLCQGRASSSMG